MGPDLELLTRGANLNGEVGAAVDHLRAGRLEFFGIGPVRSARAQEPLTPAGLRCREVAHNMFKALLPL